jgi:hypothetical protein
VPVGQHLTAHGALRADVAELEHRPTRDEYLARLAERHIEWQLPTSRPALGQGQIAGVPAKLVLHADGSALLLVATAAHHELVDRVGDLL